MNFHPYFPHLLPDMGSVQYKETCTQRCLASVSFMKIGRGKAVVFLLTLMKLNLCMYNETVDILKVRNALVKSMYCEMVHITGSLAVSLPYKSLKCNDLFKRYFLKSDDNFHS